MKTKEFESFINKTSKIVERALSNSVDVLGAFFDDGREDSAKAALNMGKNERIQTLFTFQDNEPLKRAITSIEWSPKVKFTLALEQAQYR